MSLYTDVVRGVTDTVVFRASEEIIVTQPRFPMLPEARSCEDKDGKRKVKNHHRNRIDSGTGSRWLSRKRYPFYDPRAFTVSKFAAAFGPIEVGVEFVLNTLGFN